MESVDPCKAQFDAYSGDYDVRVNRALAFSGMKLDFFTRIKTEYLLAFMTAHAQALSRASALDLGCGTGNCHPFLGGRLGRLCGIDVSAASIATASQHHPAVEYRHYDGLHIPYGEATFDFVIAICVFHHVSLGRRSQLASDVRRVLKPGGFIIIFEHNPFNPLTQLVVSRCEFDRDAILLKPATSEELVRTAGFRCIDTRFILNVPAAAWPLHRLDRWLSKVPMGAQYYTVGQK